MPPGVPQKRPWSDSEATAANLNPKFLNRQGAKSAKGDGLQKGARGATLTPHKGPSGLSVRKADPGKLGDLGVLAVKVFFSSGLNVLSSPVLSCRPADRRPGQRNHSLQITERLRRIHAGHAVAVLLLLS